MMVKLFFAGVSLLAGLGILISVVIAVGADEIMKAFSQFSLVGIAPLLALTIVSHIVSAIKWQYVLREMDIRIPLIPLIKVWLIGYAVSYITPVVYIGGEVFRAQILKDKYQVSWQKGLASVGIDKTIEAVIWIAVIFAGLAISLVQAGTSSLTRTVIVSGAAMLFFTALLIAVYFFALRGKSLVRALLRPFKLESSRAGKFLCEIEEHFEVFFIQANKKRLAKILALAVFKYLVLWARNIFLIYYLTKTIALLGGFSTLGFLYLSYFAPIPGALGAQEALLALVFTGIGFSAGTGAVFTFLLRGAEMLMVSVGIFYLLHWGLGKFIPTVLKWMKTEL